MQIIECGHIFCDECLTQYFKTKVLENTELDAIRCAACNFVFDDDFVSQKIVLPELQQQFEKLIVNKFVATSKNLVHCPAKNCELIFRPFSDHTSTVVCSCGYEFCCKCKCDKHELLPCEIMKMWKKLPSNPNYILSRDWIESNTKPCPNCSVRVFKYFHFDMVTCAECHTTFCYKCLSLQNSHYECKTEATSSTLISDHKFYSLKSKYDETMHYMDEIKKVECKDCSLILHENRMNSKILEICHVYKMGLVFACFAEPSEEKTIFEQNLHQLGLLVREINQKSAKCSAVNLFIIQQLK